MAQAVTPKQVLVQPALATAPTQSPALGMVPPAAHTLLPSPHPPLPMPVAEAQAALLLLRLQLLPMGQQGKFPCLRHATWASLDFEHAYDWSCAGHTVIDTYRRRLPAVPLALACLSAFATCLFVSLPLWRLCVLPSGLCVCSIIGSKASPNVVEVLLQPMAIDIRQHHTSSVA